MWIVGLLLLLFIVNAQFAVFYDETVAVSTGLLEHSCRSLIDLSSQTVLSVQSSSLFSAVLTASGKIYWWSVIVWPSVIR